MTENTEALAPGTTLGRHVLLEKLGEGGMGAVFMARHLLLDRIDALKVIRPHLVRDPGVLARFYQEARAAARLHHTNVVAIHDADQADGQHFLVLEFVQGTNLAALLQQKRNLSEQLVIGILYQTARGLQHIHEKGLVHRDIKPSNLLLASTTKQIKILDLGLAGLRVGGHDEAGRLTSTLQVMGTPDYIAPEQSISTRNADIRADLYALGCTAYHLLAGTVPFPDGDLFDKIRRHRDEPPLPLAALRKDLSSELVAIITRLMAKNPQARYQTPAELLATLKILRGRAESNPVAPSTATPHSARTTLDLPEAGASTSAPVHQPGARTTREVPASKPSRRRILLGLGLAGVTAASAAAAYWFWPTSPRLAEKKVADSPWSVSPLPENVSTTGTLRRWVEAGILEPESGGTLFGVAFAPDGQSLAITCGDYENPQQEGRVLVYEFGQKRWRELGRVDHASCRLVYTSDGKTLVTATGAFHLVKRVPGSVAVWNTTGGPPRTVTPLFRTDIQALVLHREGRIVLAGGRTGAIASVDLETGRTQTLQPENEGPGWNGYPARSSDGERLAWGDAAGRVTVFDGSAEKILCVTPALAKRTYLAGVGFLPGDQEMFGVAGPDANGEAKLLVWNAFTGAFLRSRVVSETFPFSVTLAPDRTTLAIGLQSGHLQIWNLREGSQTPDMQGHTSPILGLAFSPRELLLASAGSDGLVRLWKPPA